MLHWGGGGASVLTRLLFIRAEISCRGENLDPRSKETILELAGAVFHRHFCDQVRPVTLKPQHYKFISSVLVIHVEPCHLHKCAKRTGRRCYCHHQWTLCRPGLDPIGKKILRVTNNQTPDLGKILNAFLEILTHVAKLQLIANMWQELYLVLELTKPNSTRD
jgi:hypothetical protein